MASIATGFWYDHGQRPVLRPTLTLAVDDGDKLVSFLTFLVTLAGASFWDIVALLLHSWKAKQPHPTALDLQHQVSLRSTRGSNSTCWRILRIHWAWSGSRTPGLWRKTCSIAVPALVIWLFFAVASLFASTVASKAHGTVIARIEPDNCGFVDPLTSDYASKMLNDTLRARTYVSTFYTNSTNSVNAQSVYHQPTFETIVNTSAPCPVPNEKRCILGANGAFSMTSGPLNSQHQLGINTPRKDEMDLHMITTCSPIYIDEDEVEFKEIGNTTMLAFYLGPEIVGNWTYVYNMNNQNAQMNYLLEPVSSALSWQPIPDLSRIDADMEGVFLSGNNIAFKAPTSDPWFSAKTEAQITVSGDEITLYQSESPITIMICADQYKMCNPATSLCSAPGTLRSTSNELLGRNTTGVLSLPQIATVQRVLLALADSGTFRSVDGLGPSALWAAGRVFGKISPGLPGNQWQLEALGWFQTSVTRLQAKVLEFASNPPRTDLTIQPLCEAMECGPDLEAEFGRQCANQMVRTSGDVRNFAFVGVMIIVCVSVFLIVLGMTLESIMDIFSTRRGKMGGPAARRADENLYLQAALLASQDRTASSWYTGWEKVPVPSHNVVWQRPTDLRDLPIYEAEVAGHGVFVIDGKHVQQSS